MIVLNENEWAEEKIKTYDLGDNTYETLGRIAKYYISNGCAKEYTEQMLNRFLLRCNPDVSLPRWSDAIQRIVKYASSNPPINIGSIGVTSSEMNYIDNIDGTQARRLAFTLLCLAKYYDAIKETNNHWVGTKDSVIVSLANIKASINRQCNLFRKLRDIGFLEFAKRVDNTSIRVIILDNQNKDEDIALSIYDFRNLGYQYLMYRGEPFYKCENCGITTKKDNSKKANGLKYCKECAVKIAVKQRVNSVMRRRQQGNENEKLVKN